MKRKTSKLDEIKFTKLKENIVDIKRLGDRIIVIHLVSRKEILNIILCTPSRIRGEF